MQWRVKSSGLYNGVKYLLSPLENIGTSMFLNRGELATSKDVFVSAGTNANHHKYISILAPPLACAKKS